MCGLLGAAAGYEPDLYARLVSSSTWSASSPTNLGPIIARDINRTFPKHVLFRDIHQKGQQVGFRMFGLPRVTTLSQSIATTSVE